LPTVSKVARTTWSVVDSKIRCVRSSASRVKPTPADNPRTGVTLTSASSVWRSTLNGSLRAGGLTAAIVLSKATRWVIANSGVRLS
jgi:hypothetical protein